MKKWLALLLALIIIPTCSFAETLATTYDEDGNTHFLRDLGPGDVEHFIDIYDLPYTYVYNGKEISIVSNGFYKGRIDFDDYKFYHIKLDVSQLTKDEVNQLASEDMALSASFVSASQRAAEYEYMDILVYGMTSSLFKKEIDIVFYSSYDRDYNWVEWNLTFDHPTGTVVTLPNDSEAKEYMIDETILHKNRFSMATPSNLSEMDSEVYNRVKDAVSELGSYLW